MGRYSKVTGNIFKQNVLVPAFEDLSNESLVVLVILNKQTVFSTLI